MKSASQTPVRLPLVSKIARTGGEVPERAGVFAEHPKVQAPGPKQNFRPLVGYGR